MSEDNLNQSLIVNHKKGVPIYSSNPSAINPNSIKKVRPSQLGAEKKGFIIDGEGEVISHGTAVFYEYEEVDNERFIKLFTSGFQKTAELSKSGLSILEFIGISVQENPNTDEVKLSFYRASKYIIGLTERTYQRGVKELLNKEFIFRSPEDGTVFVNIRYMFNGDRLAFVRGFKRKPQQKVLK